MYQHGYKEGFIRVNQVKSMKPTFERFRKHHCEELLESIPNQGSDYSFGTVTVFFWPCANLVGSLRTSLPGRGYAKD